LPAGPAVVSPAGPPIGSSAEPPATEDGLPRRVRQASLAPQLRRKAEPLPDEATVQFRSPEQVRSIMSALQLGTTRGRIDASRYSEGGAANGHPPSSEDRLKTEEPGNEGSPGSRSFDDAATVSFPAVVNVATAGEEADQDAEHEEAPDDGSEHETLTRPEKDA
jgi:hypothetical protein